MVVGHLLIQKNARVLLVQVEFKHLSLHSLPLPRLNKEIFD